MRRYQSLAGEGESLNALLHAGTVVDSVFYGVMSHLDALLKRATLPLDVVLYRGIGDLDAAVPPHAGVALDVRTYVSTSLVMDVAREFAVGPSPAMLRIAARVGRPGYDFRHWGGANWPTSRRSSCGGIP